MVPLKKTAQMPPHDQLVSRELQGQNIWHDLKSQLSSCLILSTLVPLVFDGEVVGLASSSPARWRAADATKDFSDSETARGQGNGSDHLACLCGLTPEERGAERS